jgi:hypothetical protein
MDAVALLHAVGAPGECGAGQVAGGTEPASTTLADTKHTVAVARRALLEAVLLTPDHDQNDQHIFIISHVWRNC